MSRHKRDSRVGVAGEGEGRGVGVGRKSIGQVRALVATPGEKSPCPRAHRRRRGPFPSGNGVRGWEEETVVDGSGL